MQGFIQLSVPAAVKCTLVLEDVILTKSVKRDI